MKTGFTPVWVVLLFLILPGCGGKSSRSGQEPGGPATPGKVVPEVSKVCFFIENSESMFGYVSSITEYVEVVSELAEKPEFVMDNIPREFYFVNGTAPVITPIGNDPAILKTQLNPSGFRCGDITRSNLNVMFQTALDSAGTGRLSILISDGIYDVGSQGVQSLVMYGRETRSRFIERLQTGDLQTIMVKLSSQFSGKYFFASKKGFVPVDAQRPYYIWIFGESDVLDRYFPDGYITRKLAGFADLARFIRPGTAQVAYEATSENYTGSFKFDPKVKNRLTDARSDRHGQGFRFSIAVDYSSLPYPESYLTDVSNYSTGNNYTLVGIARPSKKIYSLSFTPTHLITVGTLKNPAGKLVVSLLNKVPAWIAASASEYEDNPAADSIHTFGFGYLTDGIVQAYESVSSEKNITGFIIDIQ